jgi:hypothetical protein
MGFWVWGFDFRVYNSWYRVRVEDSGFWVKGSEIKFQGLGFRA